MLDCLILSPDSLPVVGLAAECGGLFWRAHTPDHQISSHSDIPTLPQSEKTTTDSMNVSVYSCVSKPITEKCMCVKTKCVSELGTKL